jgi:hypothetical protein
MHGRRSRIMAFAQDEYPCNKCNKSVKRCSYSDERDWDWSTDDVCPGLIREETMTDPLYKENDICTVWRIEQ